MYQSPIWVELSCNTALLVFFCLKIGDLFGEVLEGFWWVGLLEKVDVDL